MVGELPLCLFGAGVGSYASGSSRPRDLGYRMTGLVLMGAALIFAFTPAHADQFRQAADNAEVKCSVSARDLTRISLVGDAFANVSKISTGLPGQDFTVTSEPVRGDIYLSVPEGWSATSVSFFATSRKGYVYKFSCSRNDRTPTREALAGGILSGILAARLIRRSGNRWAGLIVPIVALPLGVPAYAAFLFAPALPVALLGVGVMNFLLSSALGPCVALAVSLVAPTRRGVTSTVMLIVQNLLAFAFGPLLIGMVSDALHPSYGEDALRYALALMLVAPLAASLLLWMARRRISAG